MNKKTDVKTPSEEKHDHHLFYEDKKADPHKGTAMKGKHAKGDVKSHRKTVPR